MLFVSVPSRKADRVRDRPSLSSGFPGEPGWPPRPQSSISELSIGPFVFSNRSPQNNSPAAVRTPTDPLECPGSERIVASSPY